ncbi:hypothetical protein ABZY02_03535 [Streptomyces sp. NPDC006649]|uniref:hypothetical protein n=1 Tax=Streptomyces sp. NPDC006649 TaxID=3156896 RepID=UPI0033B36018
MDRELLCELRVLGPVTGSGTAVGVDAPSGAVRAVVGHRAQVLTGDARRRADPAADADHEALVTVNTLPGTAGGGPPSSRCSSSPTGMLVRENTAASVRRTAAVAAPALVTVGPAGSLPGSAGMVTEARDTEARAQVRGEPTGRHRRPLEGSRPDRLRPAHPIGEHRGLRTSSTRWERRCRGWHWRGAWGAARWRRGRPRHGRGREGAGTRGVPGA